MEGDTNKVWCGTFNLVWNDLMDDVIGGRVEFEEKCNLADELNMQPFKVEELSENSYFKIHGNATMELKEKIEKEIKERFNETSDVLDEVDWKDPNNYVLYAMLKKVFNFSQEFNVLDSSSFKNSSAHVKYFGVLQDAPLSLRENVDVLFYNSPSDFAVRLKTKEKEEIYLYRNDGIGKSFTESYLEMLNKERKYNGSKAFETSDTLKVPYITLDEKISYDELCNKKIKNSDLVIKKAIQTVKFELNNKGGSLVSEALIVGNKGISLSKEKRSFNFDDTFLLFLKEETKEKPYFAIRAYDTDVLVEAENN